MHKPRGNGSIGWLALLNDVLQAWKGEHLKGGFANWVSDMTILTISHWPERVLHRAIALSVSGADRASGVRVRVAALTGQAAHDPVFLSAAISACSVGRLEKPF